MTENKQQERAGSCDECGAEWIGGYRVHEEGCAEGMREAEQSPLPASPDPLAVLREAEVWTIYVCPCGEIVRGALFGRHSGCGPPQRIEVIPLKATEPLIAENEELRRERDEIQEWANQCVPAEWFEAAVARAESARSTSEALAGALEKYEAEHSGSDNPEPCPCPLCVEARSALDSARTPTEEPTR